MVVLILIYLSANGVELFRETHPGYPSMEGCLIAADASIVKMNALKLRGLIGIKINGVEMDSMQATCAG